MADVTICIPAWQADGFIDRTLRCARAQTHSDIRILVSIDKSTDQTEAICRHHAELDSRVDVLVQPERLGWSENSNFLLDRVDTEYCFLYFHDDVIEPTYTERLRSVLSDNPHVQSAHCDLERFGDEEGVVPGADYDGPVAERLIRLLVAPIKGTPLRSLIRSDLIAKGLRFPVIGGDGFWRCHPFLMFLMASGQARRVPEVLYRRWFRPDSLTKNWTPTDQGVLIEGQRESTKLCLEMIEKLQLSAAENQLVRFCLFVSIMMWTRNFEKRINVGALIEPEAISAAFRDVHIPANTDSVRPPFKEWMLQAYGQVLAMEGEHAVRKGDRETALAKLGAAISLNPGLAHAHARLGQLLIELQQKQSASAVGLRAKLLRTAP